MFVCFNANLFHRFGDISTKLGKQIIKRACFLPDQIGLYFSLYEYTVDMSDFKFEILAYKSHKKAFMGMNYRSRTNIKFSSHTPLWGSGQTSSNLRVRNVISPKSRVHIIKYIPGSNDYFAWEFWFQNPSKE